MKQIFFLLLLSFSFNMANAQKDTAAAEQYIRAARTASNEAIAKKDIASVAKYWSDNYRFERQFKQILFARGGTVAIEKGILTYTSPYNYKGYYTALWRKIDGVWVTQMENFVSIL
jgi:hypothetical protein